MMTFKLAVGSQGALFRDGWWTSGCAGLALALTAPVVPAASFQFERVPAPVYADSGRDIYAGAWGDYDGDGRPDLFLAGLDSGPALLLRNTPQGFAAPNPTNMAVFVDQVFSRAGAAWGDVDNDGRLDLAVAGAYRSPSFLYQRSGTGDFVLPPFGAVGAGALGINMLLSDIDRDGLLDGYQVNGGGAAAELGSLWRNDGTGGWRRDMTGALPAYAQYSHGGAFGDLDGDGDDDLMLTSSWGLPNALFLNEGDGTFARIVSGEVGSDAAGGGTSAAWGDYDNDGDLDLLISKCVLYRNDGGDLVRQPESVLDATDSTAIGAAWADFDNDGWLDLVVASRLSVTRWYRNLGGGRFEPVPVAASPGADGRGANGVAVADFDGDGDVDVWLSNWEARGPTMLLRNDTVGGHYLRIRLQGTRSNRSGIGAKVRVRTVVEGAERWQLRAVGGFDSTGNQELVTHFGLGPATEVDRVEIEWPSGIRQRLMGIRSDQTLEVVEATEIPLGFMPDGGGFSQRFQVSLYSGVSGAEIRYTTNGLDPDLGSARYSRPVSVMPPLTVKARAFVGGTAVTEVRSATYVRVDPLRILPPPGFFTNVVSVELATSVPRGRIRFTRDGTEPAATSDIYEGPIRVTSAMTLRAVVFQDGKRLPGETGGTYRRVYAFDDEGIPPAWRIQHFGNAYATDPRAAAIADPDHDGSHNRQEFVANTPPLDGNAGYRVVLRPLPELGFDTEPGRPYRIWRSSGISAADRESVASGTTIATPTRWVEAEPLAGAGAAFYQVESDQAFSLRMRSVPELRFPTEPGRTYRVVRWGIGPKATSRDLGTVTAAGADARWVDDSDGATLAPGAYIVERLP